jgi:hypothetical protein
MGRARKQGTRNEIRSQLAQSGSTQVTAAHLQSSLHSGGVQGGKADAAMKTSGNTEQDKRSSLSTGRDTGPSLNKIVPDKRPKEKPLGGTLPKPRKGSGI